MSDITSGAIARYQNKLVEKSPDFKRILHSRSQTHFEFSSTNRLQSHRNSQDEMDESRKELALPVDSVLQEEKDEDLSPENTIHGIGSLKDINTLVISKKPRNIAFTKNISVVSDADTLSRHDPGSTLVQPERTPALYKNLSLPHILEQQRKFAQLGKIVMESNVNPRFKERVDLPALTNRDFIAKEVIEKFKKDEAKCKLSNTFRYKRKTHDESIVLNSTPAAYWPMQEDHTGVLIPTMRINRIKEKNKKQEKFKLLRNMSQPPSASLL